jgi:hypothetical protein
VGSSAGREGGKPVAGLAFRTESRELNPALGSVGELKNVIAHSVLGDRGFTDVVNAPSEVAGNRNACRVCILYLHIGDRNFWRVVIGMCDDGFDPARMMVDEVAGAIDQLAFL